MTEIEFHFNVQDKLLYSCRLLRKIYRTGTRAVITAEPEVLTALDRMLWLFSATEFVPHCTLTADQKTLAATPVLLAVRPGGCPPDSVLINLGQAVAGDFERFQRFIELVGSPQDDREAGRSRWKHYKDRGYALKRHDLSARPEAA